MNESFVFYKSFYDAVKDFDNDTIAEFFKLVSEYAFTGVIAETENKVAKALFLMTMPQIDANKKRRENGKLGGAKLDNKNAKKTTESRNKKQKENDQKQPMVEFKNDQKQPMVEFKNDQKQPNVNVNVNVNDIGYYPYGNNQLKKEKDNNKIIIQKEKNFDSIFQAFKDELLSDSNELWRETIERKFGIKNIPLALDEFKTHIVAQGKERAVEEMGLNDFKAYFSNSARIGFLSELVKQVPAKPAQRKPCEFYTQRTGGEVVGVIKQDGLIFYVPASIGFPPTDNHYWNPANKQYEIQQR